ncbi:MAG: shikimate dehydrogenase [bacterium]
MKTYLVVGCPVAHSLSPAMMTAAFAAAHLEARYEAREILPERWPGEMAALHREGIAGANVTLPHKEGALAGAVGATAVAQAIGAANVLVRREAGWLADNTDGPGFLDWLREEGSESLLQREALVLGAGGSARAVVWALLAAGCPRVRVANRSRARADALVRAAPGRVVSEGPGGAVPAGGLVVQCTSLGLRADDPLPLAGELLEGAGRVVDLVYPDTALVRAARERGVSASGGLGLLVAQGALAFERWTGQRPDARVLRAAAEAELLRRG